MSESSGGSSGGLGLFSILFIVFVVLKLIGSITWSWWWVTSPLWGSAVFAVVVALVVWVYVGFIVIFNR